MNLKLKALNVIFFVFMAMIALCVVDQNIPEAIQETRVIQNLLRPAIPTDKDLNELQEGFEELLNYLDDNQVKKDEIVESYAQVQNSPVCSIANRNFNLLATQYDDYMRQLSQIEGQIEKLENRYNRYIQLLDNIPEFSMALREERNSQFEEVIQPLYDKVCTIKSTYTLDRENVERMYNEAKQIADDMFYEYYDLMCHIVNAEAGSLKCTSMERCYVANVIENRIKNPNFPNTIYSVVYAPNQYSPTWNGSIHLKPFEWVKTDMENYLRGRVETGMPDNVMYQARFSQGSGIWKVMESGHVFCYY